MPEFDLSGLPMSRLEAVAALLGLANVWLVVRRSIWNYPVGIAMVGLYAAVFYDSRLYSDALLQLVFIVLNIYGWLTWTRARTRSEVPVRWLDSRGRVHYLLAALIIWASWSTAMARLTDAVAPYADGAVACLSVIAQILLARRFVENWLYWVVVNALAIGLFTARGLVVTAILYCVFLAMAVIGFQRWRSAAASGSAP